MEQILLLQNPHWKGDQYPQLFTRHLLSKLLKQQVLKEIQVLLGMRRSGKSTLFKLLINELMQHHDAQSILYLNLDDPYFSETWQDPKSLYRVIELAEKLTGSSVQFLFLDEIQVIEGWEHFVKSQYDMERFQKIWITGSNAQLLSGEYTSLLSGRYIVDHVYPLSFQEHLSLENIKTQLELLSQKPKALKMAENHMNYGSFPEPLKFDDPELKRSVLKSYFDSILLKDCIERHQIRDVPSFKSICLYLLDNVASLYSYASLAKATQTSDQTLKSFLAILQEAFLFQEIQNFSYSQKPASRPKKKSYCLDNGLIYATTFRYSQNLGKLFENLVFIELLKQGIEQISFYNDKYECDFIIEHKGERHAIQVAYELNAQNTTREVRGLVKAIEQCHCQQGVIITFNQEMTLESQHEVLPFWKYFHSSPSTPTPNKASPKGNHEI